MKRNEDVSLKSGDIYLMEFEGNGSEQKGWRPGLIIQNNTGNVFSPNIIAVPLTSVVKKKCMPTHVLLDAEKVGLKRNSVVLCENPQRMSKEKVGNYIATLPDFYMNLVAKAYTLSTSLISFLNIDELISTWQKATELNSAV